MRDLGVGSGTFLKVDDASELVDNHMINIGDTYILVNLLFENKRLDYIEDETEQEYPRLRVKVFGGPSTGQVYYFDP